MLQLLATVRSGRMDSFKRGPRARAFSLSERPERQRKETAVDLETPFRTLLSDLGLDLYDLDRPRRHAYCEFLQKVAQVRTVN